MKTIRSHKSWILAALCMSIFALPLLTVYGAFDAFMYDLSGEIEGETQDETASSLGAFEILSFELGAENNINIGSISTGGGAGKATFKEMTITRKVDSASTGFFSKLAQGGVINEMQLYLRRPGAEIDSKNGANFLEFNLKLVMIQDVSWSGSDGDDIIEETVVLQYGAMKIDYYKQDKTGAVPSSPTKSASWSRVLNTAAYDVSY